MVTTDQSQRSLPRGQAPISEVIAALPFRIPGRLDAKVDAQLAAGRLAALAGTVDHTVSDGEEVGDQVQHQQDLVRKAALDKLLTAKREDCRVGLECLAGDQHALELQGWLDNPHARTLILAGRPGNGKTQAAYATAAHAARYGAQMWNARKREAELRRLIVRGGPVNEYLRRLRPDGSPDPVWQIRHEAIWAELWIGDDLGAELDDVASRFMREQLADLLDARLERNLRQIYTTNHPSAVVRERLGDRMWSRLQEECTLIEFTGPDRRVRKALKW